MEDDKEGQPRFQVKDRRRFADTGEARSEAAAEPETRAEPPPSPGAPQTSRAAPDVEPVTFSTFILGLSTQALLHLGEIPNPGTGTVERDLAAARQVIDILGVIRTKTRNNLDQGEEALLDGCLYDLRMRYVELVRSAPKEGA